MALDLRHWHKPRHVGIPWMGYLGMHKMSRDWAHGSAFGPAQLFSLRSMKSSWRAWLRASWRFVQSAGSGSSSDINRLGEGPIAKAESPLLDGYRT
jgi:hypothetical protein